MATLNDKLELASRLFASEERAEAVRRVSAVAVAGSEDGTVEIQFEDDEDTIVVPCVAGVAEDDEVEVLIEGGHATVLGAAGWGDSVEEGIDDASKVATNYLHYDTTRGLVISEDASSPDIGNNIQLKTDGVHLRSNTDEYGRFTGDGLHVENGEGTVIAHLGYGETVHTGSGQTVSTSYFSFGERGGTSSNIGAYSVAEGVNTVAGDYCAHAEGRNTTAAGQYSHAEGYGTSANSVSFGYSPASTHAEGNNTTADGRASHSEGEWTSTALNGSIRKWDESAVEQGDTANMFSHAEGYGTVAKGLASHAEGTGSLASGNYSHAAGLGTTASDRGQTAIGIQNVSASGPLVIGNGEYDSESSPVVDTHSNAALVDWSGNLRIAGDVYVGCNDDSTGGTKLVNGGGGGSIPTTTAMLKGDGQGNAVAATPGTDYIATMPNRALSPSDGGNASKANAILYGTVDGTSTATAFTATIAGLTAYTDGTCMMLHNGVVTSAAGFTVNVNNLGAKHCYNNMTNATQDTTIFNVNYTMLFVYDGSLDSGAGGWWIYRGYNSDNNTIGYQLRTNSTVMPTVTRTRYYRLLFTSADDAHWVPANTGYDNSATSVKTVNQNAIDPFGRIVYMSGTTNVNANANVGATVTWDQYTLSLGYSFNRTGSALTLTNPAPVFVKCAPQSNGSAIMDSTTPIVQSLPSSADGKIYIFLGMAYSATNIELRPQHPVYWHDGTTLRIWTGAETVKASQLATVATSGDYADLTTKLTMTDAEVDAAVELGFPYSITTLTAGMTLDKNEAFEGDTVTVTVSAKGTVYAYANGISFDNSGVIERNATWSFTMPGADVSIDFQAAPR